MAAASELLMRDERVVLLLGDIGVFGFRHAASDFPERVINIGILEQSTIGLAAGLSIEGHIPIIHSIAPFLVERALEQIKIDFGYQSLEGNLVSVGASYDYAALGATHHCPGDVSILLSVPDVQIVVPGTANEFGKLIKEEYANGSLTYFRLSEATNSDSHAVRLGKANLLKSGSEATVVCFGPTLDMAIEATVGLDVNLLYMTSIRPFDYEAIKSVASNGRVLLVEPFFEGTCVAEVVTALRGQYSMIDTVGLPKVFRHEYGTRQEHYSTVGFTSARIRSVLEDLIVRH